MKKCLKRCFLFLLSCLVSLLFGLSETRAETKKAIKETIQIYSFDTIQISKKDTLYLIGKGRKKKGKVYYRTSNPNITIQTAPENKSGVWLGFISKILIAVFRAKV